MKISHYNINLKDWEFEFQQRNSHPILMADQWCRSLYSNFKDEINLPVPRYNYLITGLSRGYLPRKQKTKVIYELKKAVTEPNYLRYLYSTTHKRVRDLEKISHKINQRLAIVGTSGDKMADMWQEFNRVLMTVIPWFYIPWYVIEYNLLTDQIKNRLGKYETKIGQITDINNALIVLVFPVKKVFFHTEQDDFYKLVECAKHTKNFVSDEVFLKIANAYLKKYAWTTTYLFLPLEPLTLRKLIQNIEQAIKDNGLETYQIQRSQNLKNKRLYNSLIKKVKSDKKLIQNIEAAQRFGWLLSWSVEKSLIITAGLIPWYKSIAKQLKIKYSRLTLLTYTEILGGLRDGLKVKEAELKKRETAYVFLIKQGKTTLVTGQVAKKLTKYIDKGVHIKEVGTNNISGQPTSPGKTQGRVRVVMLAKDSHNIKKGEVLVCSMTSPDYVPAMKRAVAILTDEGGLLCHAAIVSRELGKPCIVGIKNVSRVLKNGDLVEVDADKGIVKILKK